MKTFLALAVGLMLGSTTASAQPPVEPQIVVTGEGIVKATPDQAWVSIGAESRSKVSKDAQQRNAEAMQAVMQKIASFGIAKDAIKTTAIDLQMEFDYNNGKQTLRGYVARNSIEVRIDDLARVGEVVDLAVGSGATSVGGVRFDLKDREAAEREALRLAVADAKARAEAAASGAGVRIESVIRIEEQGGMSPEPRPLRMAARASAEMAKETPITAGDIEIRAAVRLTATIK